MLVNRSSLCVWVEFVYFILGFNLLWFLNLSKSVIVFMFCVTWNMKTEQPKQTSSIVTENQHFGKL